jgi:hypothetical protein
MAEQRYIRCRECDKLHHITRFDGAPAYVMEGGEERQLSRDDGRAFLERHTGHPLEALTEVGEKCFPVGAAGDPMRVGYVEATNGRESFVIRRFRKTIAEPLEFELIRGRLKPYRVAVAIQEARLRKEMKQRLRAVASERTADEKTDLFIEVFNDLVGDLNPEAIKVVGYDYADASLEYGWLEPPMVDVLMQKLSPHFSAAELDAVRGFIDAHREPDDVLALLLKRDYAIERAGA